MVRKRGPNYYEWALDKSKTTNDVYGEFFKNEPQSPPPKRGPYSYEMPFEVKGMYPQYAMDNRPDKYRLPRPRPSKDYNPPGDLIKYDIRQPYVPTALPIHERIKKTTIPPGFMYSRKKLVPPGYPFPKRDGTVITRPLSKIAEIVHVRNFPPNPPYWDKYIVKRTDNPFADYKFRPDRRVQHPSDDPTQMPRPKRLFLRHCLSDDSEYVQPISPRLVPPPCPSLTCPT